MPRFPEAAGVATYDATDLFGNYSPFLPDLAKEISWQHLTIILIFIFTSKNSPLQLGYSFKILQLPTLRSGGTPLSRLRACGRLE
jgi:hypothetical protein